MRTESLRTSERGAILVFTAIAIIVLLGFVTFVADYGVLWVSRAQAQNAADAGALAGAIARAYDDPASPPAVGGVAEESAIKAASPVPAVGVLGNMVWNATNAQQLVNVTWNCPVGVVGRCVRVEVFRNGWSTSGRLPVFFGPVLGITSQGVRAMAVARVATANATNCMRPFAVVDRWWENRDPPFDYLGSEFDRWDSSGNPLPGTVDWYEPPTSATVFGSGYAVPADVGRLVTLKTTNNPNSAAGSITPGWGLPLRLPDGAGGYTSGANDFSNAIKQCIGNPVAIGDYLPTETGVMMGPTNQGVSTDTTGSTGGPSLINQDPYATWTGGMGGSVSGSCAADTPACAPFSPRIVPIAVFDFDEFAWRSEANDWTTAWVPATAGTPGQPGAAGAFNCPVGGRCVRVTNIIGFFVESYAGGDVTGRVVMYPGEFVVGPPNTGGGFLQVIQLIR